MADIKSPVNPLFLREEEIRQGIELLFYAYRGFTAEPDALLATLGLGRAHHRALYFIGRHPEITVSALLAILRITKQSLGRVLNELVERGYVEQQQGQRDRRQRLLTLTDKGEGLERQLFESQRKLIGQAYRNAGAEAVDGFRKVLEGLIALSEPTALEEEPDAPAAAPRVASR
ncbi:MarR family winged helix-turn-helix transcriptional regulator [Inquilinus limosus]|uniref:MarR family transcriptional regulator n=1 Tax=Inquilinus limosus MP06 TaxID=1398085 RepID=A0A0A0D3E3_9PROT|nr:MarR family transcriptional regulator [Inquilinus limosus]KGM33236.1 MarR family transcriptional regulator [Inquilinus limosus MP06]